MHPSREASDQAETVTVPEPSDMMQSKPRRQSWVRRHLGELVGTIIIFGALCMVVLPDFIAYRHRPPSPLVGLIESVRAAIAAYAADSVGNSFPSDSDISNYAALVTIVNANGATLTMSEAAQGFTLRRYTAIDADQDGIYGDYTMSFQIPSIPAGKLGSVIFVTPAGLQKLKR